MGFAHCGLPTCVGTQPELCETREGGTRRGYAMGELEEGEMIRQKEVDSSHGATTDQPVIKHPLYPRGQEECVSGERPKTKNNERN